MPFESLHRSCLFLFVILISCCHTGTLAAHARIQESADEVATKVEDAELLIQQLRDGDWNMGETREWVKLLKQLVDIGPAAVDPVCKALRGTEKDFEMRLFGFALRAIGDPRAVQTLIESLPKTLLPPGSDYGLKVDDEDLMKFMRAHDLGEEDFDASFGFGRPVNEINGAIVKLTNHKPSGGEIVHVFLDGGPVQRHLKRKLYFDHAARWHEWWAENYLSRGVDMAYVDVDLPKFKFKTPKIVNEFVENAAQMTGSRSGNIIEPFDSAQYFGFYDLDTGRICKLPKQFDADSSIEKVSQWARGEGYDLMGIPYTKDDDSKMATVMMPLGMKAWQNPIERYATIDNEIGDKNIQMGTPRTKYLAYFDDDSGEYDPNREACFLYRTAEGTCGALKVVCQVTERLTKEDYGKPVRDTPKHRGPVLGVKFESKMFVSQ